MASFRGKSNEARRICTKASNGRWWTVYFRVTGSTLLFDGYLKVYAAEEEKEEKITIPSKLAEKEALSLEELSPKQHFTQPPPRFTEATLVKELEKEGIGRPSTYATYFKDDTRALVH